ncbi:hypothetical protein ACJIZ3_005387 [Penstemon smallii]|uniref:Ribosomal protein L33 n=1 Tax=Penstemon smallii TaxID=265156 RepID=A0ABD3S4V4_9LAMI
MFRNSTRSSHVQQAHIEMLQNKETHPILTYMFLKHRHTIKKNK